MLRDRVANRVCGTLGRASITDRSFVLASLYHGLTPVFAGEWFDDARLARSGVLAPGTYYFLLQSSAVGWNAPPGVAHVNSAGSFGFRFNLAETAAPVPQPASLLLVGTGLVGTIARLRRRRA